VFWKSVSQSEWYAAGFYQLIKEYFEGRLEEDEVRARSTKAWWR
jgi:hypothetical protein